MALDKEITFKWWFKQPHMMWLAFSVVLILSESLFSDHENYQWITLTLALVYTFSMCMFMYTLRHAMQDTWRRLEGNNMNFITDAIAASRGRVRYMYKVHNPEGILRKWRMRLFGITYLRPYGAEFLDDGICSMKAHLEIPVTKKQLFQIKLLGGYDTTSREHAEKALELLGVKWPLP